MAARFEVFADVQPWQVQQSNSPVDEHSEPSPLELALARSRSPPSSPTSPIYPTSPTSPTSPSSPDLPLHRRVSGDPDNPPPAWTRRPSINTQRSASSARSHATTDSSSSVTGSPPARVQQFPSQQRRQPPPGLTMTRARVLREENRLGISNGRPPPNSFRRHTGNYPPSNRSSLNSTNTEGMTAEELWDMDTPDMSNPMRAAAERPLDTVRRMSQQLETPSFPVASGEILWPTALPGTDYPSTPKTRSLTNLSAKRKSTLRKSSSRTGSIETSMPKGAISSAHSSTTSLSIPIAGNKSHTSLSSRPPSLGYSLDLLSTLAPRDGGYAVAASIAQNFSPTSSTGSDGGRSPSYGSAGSGPYRQRAPPAKSSGMRWSVGDEYLSPPGSGRISASTSTSSFVGDDIGNQASAQVAAAQVAAPVAPSPLSQQHTPEDLRPPAPAPIPLHESPPANPEEVLARRTKSKKELKVEAKAAAKQAEQEAKQRKIDASVAKAKAKADAIKQKEEEKARAKAEKKARQKEGTKSKLVKPAAAAAATTAVVSAAERAAQPSPPVVNGHPAPQSANAAQALRQASPQRQPSPQRHPSPHQQQQPPQAFVAAQHRPQHLPQQHQQQIPPGAAQFGPPSPTRRLPTPPQHQQQRQHQHAQQQHQQAYHQQHQQHNPQQQQQYQQHQHQQQFPRGPQPQSMPQASPHQAARQGPPHPSSHLAAPVAVAGAATAAAAASRSATSTPSSAQHGLSASSSHANVNVPAGQTPSPASTPAPSSRSPSSTSTQTPSVPPSARTASVASSSVPSAKAASTPHLSAGSTLAVPRSREGSTSSKRSSGIFTSIKKRFSMSPMESTTTLTKARPASVAIVEPTTASGSSATASAPGTPAPAPVVAAVPTVATDVPPALPPKVSSPVVIPPRRVNVPPPRPVIVPPRSTSLATDSSTEPGQGSVSNPSSVVLTPTTSLNTSSPSFFEMRPAPAFRDRSDSNASAAVSQNTDPGLGTPRSADDNDSFVHEHASLDMSGKMMQPVAEAPAIVAAH